MILLFRSRCNSKILASVDNYALLNLDIAWCYLCLRSVGQIPDAENRLKKCEENFHLSYGANLERLIALKGTSGLILIAVPFTQILNFFFFFFR